MSNKVTFFIGLPGSGKTIMAEEMRDFKKKYFNIEPIILDDVYLKQQLDDFFKVEFVDTQVFVIDCNFCNIDILTSAIKKFLSNNFTEMEFVYFENEPEKCRLNDMRRGRELLSTKLIYELSKIYSPPKNSLEVY